MTDSTDRITRRIARFEARLSDLYSQWPQAHRALAAARLHEKDAKERFDGCREKDERDRLGDDCSRLFRARFDAEDSLNDIERLINEFHIAKFQEEKKLNGKP